MAAPVVDRLENELKEQAIVVRLDVQHPVGSAVADAHQVRLVPTLLVFNDQGRLVYRKVGIPDGEQVFYLVQRMIERAEN